MHREMENKDKIRNNPAQINSINRIMPRFTFSYLVFFLFGEEMKSKRTSMIYE